MATHTTALHRIAPGVLAVAILVVGAVVLLPLIASAQANPEINYQGKLTDNTGSAVADGSYNMRFYLYNTTGGATSTAIWTEELTGSDQVTVTSGLFSVMLGSTTPLSGVDFDQPLYLGVEIGGTGSPSWDGEMAPRKVLGTVPAAFQAQEANNAAALGGVASSSFLRSDQADTMEATTASSLLTITQNGTGDILNLFDGASEVLTVNDGGNVGIGTTNPDSALDVIGTGISSRNSGAAAVIRADRTDGQIVSLVGGSNFTGFYFDETGDFGIQAVTRATAEGVAFPSIEMFNVKGDTGNVGIGTTTPSSRLTVAGDAYITGALRDSTNSAGTNGNILQTTGSGTQWVATSTLGFAAAGSGVSTFLGLSDTPSSFTANRIPFTNAAGDALTDNNNFVFDGTNLGLGTSTPASLFSLANTVNQSATAGISQNYTVNPSAGGTVAFGNELNITNNPTADNALLGSIIRVTDSATTSNIVRGLEVQTDVGSNTLGENTAITAFANTFGVRGVTTGAAGGTFAPAGILAESEGTTQGNALRAFSDTIQSADLVSFLQESSGFTGDGLVMNLGGSGGSFSGRFLNLQNSGTTNFSVSATGSTYIAGNLGLGTTTSSSKLTVSGDAYITGALRDSSNSAGSNGYVLQTTGSSTAWVATSTLGFAASSSVISTFTGLSDTQSSLTANRLLFTNGAGDALIDSANLTFDDTALTVGGNILPGTNLTYDLGSSTSRFANVWAETLNIGTSTWSIWNGGDDRLAFSNQAEQGGTEALTILSNGSLGIGTSTPTEALELGEDSRLKLSTALSNLDASSLIRLQWTATSGKPAIGWFDENNDRQAAIVAHHSSGLNDNIHKHLSFETSDSAGALQTRLDIDWGKDQADIKVSSADFNIGAGNALNVGTSGGLNSTSSFYGDIYGYGTRAVGFGDKDWASAGLQTGAKWEFYRDASDANLMIHAASASSESNLHLRVGTRDWNIINDGTDLMFEAENSTKMSIMETGEVGIGTSTPSSKLTVSGDAYITGALRDSNNSAGSNGYVLQTTGTSTAWVATSTLGFGSSNVSTLNDLTNTTLSSPTNGELLSYNGSAWVNIATSTLNLSLGDTTGTLASTRGGTGLTSYTTGDLIFATSTDTLATRAIGSAGDVLQVVNGVPNWVATSTLGFASAGSGVSTFLGLSDTPGSFTANRIPFTNSAGDALIDSANLTFDDSTLTIGGDILPSTTLTYDLGSSTSRFKNVWAETLNIGTSTWSIWNGADDRLAFSNQAEQGGAEALTILSDGKVGIGTNNPGSTLEVLGDIKTTSLLWASGGSTGTVRSARYENFNDSANANGVDFGVKLGATEFQGLSWQQETAWTSGSSTADKDVLLQLGVLQDNADFAPMTLRASGNVGIGTTTPSSKLTIENLTLDGAGVSGLNLNLETTNSVNGATQFGNQFNLLADNTATTTLVGSIYRIEDNTSFGNTVRGLEVQTDRGSNTQGENTALSGFARTFGVRGVTSADAGGSFEPAGGYFESEGTTQGNAIRGYSSSITSASLLSLFQDSSAFTGTGLQMNFGNSGGSFSSTTASNFIDLQNAGSSRFTVGAYGMLTIGDGSTVNNAGIQIGYGGLCVDNDGGCNASTTGRIAAVDYYTGNSDLAEIYFSSEALEPGELVYTQGELSVGRASTETADRILGIVSTKPGLLLGADDTSLTPGQTEYPIALSGRVPLKLSTENGPIEVGDKLMLSSVPGVAMKATSTGRVVGVALENFDGSRAYSDTYVNQFGDDIAPPVYEPIRTAGDPRINDGCYYGGGTAAGEADCTPLAATTTDAQVREAEALAEAEAQEVALDQLRQQAAKTVSLPDGGSAKVGQIVVFVENENRHLSSEGEEMIAALLSSEASTTALATGAESTLWQRLVDLASRFVDGVLSIVTLQADRVETDELCVDEVCVTGDELRALLDGQGASASGATDVGTADAETEDTTTLSNDTTDGGATTEDVTDTVTSEPTASTSDEVATTSDGTTESATASSTSGGSSATDSTADATDDESITNATSTNATTTEEATSTDTTATTETTGDDGTDTTSTAENATEPVADPVSTSTNEVTEETEEGSVGNEEPDTTPDTTSEPAPEADQEPEPTEEDISTTTVDEV